jgi:hypothetical protein
MNKGLQQLGFDIHSIQVIVLGIFDLFNSKLYSGLKIEGLTEEGYRTLTDYLWDIGLLDNSDSNWYFDGNYSLNDEQGLKQKSFFEKNKIAIPEINEKINAIKFDNPAKKIFLISHIEDVLFNYERAPDRFKINVSEFSFSENSSIIAMFREFNFTVDISEYPIIITLKMP